MATAGRRAAIGSETARMEGEGVGGQAVHAAKTAVTGRTGRARHHHGHGVKGVRTEVTNESEAYCPNPNLLDLPKEFETRVQVIQRYPEMRTVEQTDYVKKIVNEDRVVTVPKTRVVMDEVRHVDRVPIMREVPKTRTEVVHGIVPRKREVTDMVPVVDYVDKPRIERVPRVVVENVEERISVPVLKNVPVTRMVEVPTGNYCEAPVGEYVNPTDFNLLDPKHGYKTGGIPTRSPNSSSSSYSNTEHNGAALHTTGSHGHHRHNPFDDGTTGLDHRHNLDGSTTASTNPTTPSRKHRLLGKILHHH